MLGMKRRDFLKGTAATAATAVFRGFGAEAEALSVDGHVFPEWVAKPILECVARYWEWKGTDETVAFPIMTDCHSKSWGFSTIDLRRYENLKYATVESLNLAFKGPENWRDAKLHILMMRKLAHLAEADFIADLGDHDFQFFAFRDPIPLELARAAMQPYRKLYETETLPTLFARGNHDHASRRIPDEEYGEKFNRSLNVRKRLNWKLSADGTFGYCDFPRKRFRVVFLNSSRKYVNGLDAEQLQFMADAFASAPEGWTVVEMDHIPVHHVLNARRCLDAEECRNMRVAYAIMDDYANRRGDFHQGWGKAEKNVWTLPGKQGSVRWNFKDAKSRFAGAFFGHEHVEDFLHYGNVPLVVRPGLGTMSQDCIAGEMRDPKNGGYLPKETVLLDLVAVKPAKRQVHVFRCGLGGVASDLEYVYA